MSVASVPPSSAGASTSPASAPASAASGRTLGDLPQCVPDHEHHARANAATIARRRRSTRRGGYDPIGGDAPQSSTRPFLPPAGKPTRVGAGRQPVRRVRAGGRPRAEPQRSQRGSLTRWVTTRGIPIDAPGPRALRLPSTPAEEEEMKRREHESQDQPGTPETPSPRTTIVGGRPPEERAPARPVPTGIQRLLRLAALDPAFRDELVRRRAAAAGAAGVALTTSEAAVLAAIPTEQLEQMAGSLPPPARGRRDFLRQTAATAVVLLGGAALGATQIGCPIAAGGARPDMPPPPEDDDAPQNRSPCGSSGDARISRRTALATRRVGDADRRRGSTGHAPGTPSLSPAKRSLRTTSSPLHRKPRESGDNRPVTESRGTDGFSTKNLRTAGAMRTAASRRSVETAIRHRTPALQATAAGSTEGDGCDADATGPLVGTKLAGSGCSVRRLAAGGAGEGSEGDSR